MSTRESLSTRLRRLKRSIFSDKKNGRSSPRGSAVPGLPSTGGSEPIVRRRSTGELGLSAPLSAATVHNRSPFWASSSQITITTPDPEPESNPAITGGRIVTNLSCEPEDVTGHSAGSLSTVCQIPGHVSSSSSPQQGSRLPVHPPDSSFHGPTDLEDKELRIDSDFDDSPLLPKIPQEKSSSTGSKVFSAAKTVVELVRESSDACAILKSVSGGLSALMQQYDVSSNVSRSGGC
jgi:hypothetical protein